jgi:predicted Zn-dependent protease
MLKKRFLLSTLYFLLATIFLTGCTTIFNPATGKRETFFINTAAEIAIGKNVAREVLEKYKVLEDEKTQEYVQAIGQKVASVSDRRDLEYSFTVLDCEELNAFALPGGGVYINKGLVGKLNEDEIACVLAHEVGHIAARHSVKRIQGQIGYQLLMAVTVYEVSKKDKKLAKNVAKGATAIFELVLLGYSRQDELLADKLAIKYAHKADYSPWGMVSSLKKLEEYSKEKKGWRPLVVLRSHPYLEDRIRVAEAEAGALLR